jgi:hypothetical protein
VYQKNRSNTDKSICIYVCMYVCMYNMAVERDRIIANCYQVSPPNKNIFLRSHQAIVRFFRMAFFGRFRAWYSSSLSHQLLRSSDDISKYPHGKRRG